LRRALKIGIDEVEGLLAPPPLARGQGAAGRSWIVEILTSPVWAVPPGPPAADPHRAHAKGAVAVIYGEPETSRFLVAVQRLKRQQRRKARLTRQAKERVRVALRKMREG
jgi:hypothetical protein